MTKQEAKQIVEFVAKHSSRESSLLYPDPAWVMSDPHGLLAVVQALGGLSEEEIDCWCVGVGTGEG